MQTNVGRVLANRLDVGGQFNLALVNVAETGSSNSLCNIFSLDGAEQATGLAGLDGQRDRLGLQSVSLLLSSFN